MGYVGNQTSNSYSSMDKQTITGDGGASYTLTHAVANAQEIEVFVNNVRQEAGVAYTVNGTALSMTGNVASTDDFYVIYQGKALQTVVPPDGSVSTGKLASGAVTDAKIDTMAATKLTGTINNARMPAGSVIQTVLSTPHLNGIPNTGDAYASTTSTTYYNMGSAGYHYVDITPTSSSSKILVSASFPAYGSGNAYYIFKRSINSGTYEDLTDFDSSLTNEGMGLAANNWGQTSFFWLDTPNTTDTIRYAIFAKVTSGTGYIGWANVSSTTEHNFSVYTAQEIAG